MGWAIALLGLALGGAARAASQPTDQALVYFNARMALREGRAVEAVQLWLLRNSIEDRTGHVSAYDEDFRSVTWAALGELGVCTDGQPKDDGGAGLWPVALHNWVVRNMGRRQRASLPRPYDAFEVGRQQRFVSISDVLDAKELTTLRLTRGGCFDPRLALVHAGEPPTADLSDRQVAARLLRDLLERSRDTLAHQRVKGWAAIEARLFDIDLQLTALAAREARLQARERARRGRVLGLSRESVSTMRDEAPTTTLSPESEAARILRACVNWPVSEWMALSADRRLFLFLHARANGGDEGALDAIALGIVDRSIELGEGEEVARWIAVRAPADDPSALEVIWGGSRGERLLALGREAGFRERSVIALHRGVDQLQRGDLPAALRSMAFALQHAPESQATDEIERLSRRWLSYVASRFEITDELLVTLRELVPRRDYGMLLEDLMWRATFRADLRSFERGRDNLWGRGALERRLDLLHPLAAGDVGRFSRRVRVGLADAPSETLRFLDELVQRLEGEDGDVRAAQLPTLRAVRTLLLPLATDDGTGGRPGRAAGELVDRIQAIIEGLGGLGPGAGDRARSLAPTSEVFAGSVRLAPVDPLPWPFAVVEPPAPSVFAPLALTPVEWRDRSGELVFGWSIGG